MPVIAPRLLLSVVLAAVVMTGVAACAPEGEVATPEQSTVPSGTPGATASAVPGAEPGAVANTPVDLRCDELLTPQAVYDFNPNYALDASYTPAAGTDAATIVARDGIACGWVNQTSGSVVAVAVANLPATELDALRNALVTESNSVPTYEVEGYFRVATGGGEAEAFAGPYWIVATSDYFAEPGDAAPIVDAARSALGQ